jgi:hypothetical protein
VSDLGPETIARDGWLLGRLPRPIADSFTAEQRAALREAAAIPANRDRPPVNIRFSVPILKWRFFVAVFGGAERRSPERRARDREQNPLATFGNLLFILGVVLAFYLIALIAIALSTSILEY